MITPFVIWETGDERYCVFHHSETLVTVSVFVRAGGDWVYPRTVEKVIMSLNETYGQLVERVL